jgi:hypothetical protein
MKISGDILNFVFIASVNAIGDKLILGVNDTVGVIVTRSKLSPVLLTPVVNLDFRISPRIFEQIRNGPYGTLKGLGGTDS